MTELVQAVRDAQTDEQAMATMLAHINDSFEICIPEDKVPAVAGLAIAMKAPGREYGCNAGAIQCWNALQDELGVLPCAAFSSSTRWAFLSYARPISTAPSPR